jgi:ABC-type glycerol-3-phosphate transport system permease component
MKRHPHLLQWFIITVAIIWLLPFVWMVCASFKAPAEFFSATFLPWGDLGRLTLDNYRGLLGNFPFFGWLLNSLFLASVQTVVVVLLSSLGGFALATYRFRGRSWIVALMLLTLLVPVLVLRGAISDILTRETVAAMREVKPDLEVVEVPGRGHAPVLDEPTAREAIDQFLRRHAKTP